MAGAQRRSRSGATTEATPRRSFSEEQQGRLAVALARHRRSEEERTRRGEVSGRYIREERNKPEKRRQPTCAEADGSRGIGSGVQSNLNGICLCSAKNNAELDAWEGRYLTPFYAELVENDFCHRTRCQIIVGVLRKPKCTSKRLDVHSAMSKIFKGANLNVSTFAIGIEYSLTLHNN